jgi:hypothetical protein
MASKGGQMMNSSASGSSSAAATEEKRSLAAMNAAEEYSQAGIDAKALEAARLKAKLAKMTPEERDAYHAEEYDKQNTEYNKEINNPDGKVWDEHAAAAKEERAYFDGVDKERATATSEEEASYAAEDKYKKDRDAAVANLDVKNPNLQGVLSQEVKNTTPPSAVDVTAFNKGMAALDGQRPAPEDPNQGYKDLNADTQQHNEALKEEERKRRELLEQQAGANKLNGVMSRL